MNIKDLFETSEDGKITYEQFEKLAKEKGAKFADLSDGKYVSKSKYDADIKDKDTQMNNLNEQITSLNGTIATRDTDLADLQKRIEAANGDAAKITELGNSLTNLQAKYDADVKDYQNRMKQQSYEFAVREFANTKKFSSNAAKRDFTQAMIAKNLQMEGSKLIGGDDFVNIYAQDNADAFYVEPPVVEPEPQQSVTPEPEATSAPTPAVPTIVAPTPGPAGTNSDAGFGFNFLGVRSHQ